MDHLAARFASQRQLHVGILLFPEIEVLDFAGPFEVFSVAARISAASLGSPPFRVSLLGTGGAVTARHGLRVLPHLTLDEAAGIDLLLVPGGVVDALLADAPTMDWIARTAETAAATASVCTGAFALAQLGLLDGLAVTTHWEDIPLLRQAYPALDVRAGPPYLDHGRIATSAGISAGIELSLHLVGRVLGAAWAEATARQMEYHRRVSGSA